LHVAFKVNFSACGFCEHRAADVAGDFVNGVAEDELLVAAFWAFHSQKCAAWFGDEFVPFAHGFCFPPLDSLSDNQFSQSYTVFVTHEATDFAFYAESLFFGGFGELFLEGVFLSSVTLFFSFVVALAFG
jgi:hypothetical protein